LDVTVSAGKGNHALYRESERLPDQPLPGVWLAHFALRSPHQQVLRVVTAELQKLSRGQAHEGLDLHYRLGFQLLSEDADLFFSTVVQPAEHLKLDPVAYRGGPLRYANTRSDFARSAGALIPFLEKLARSHGRLVDAQPSDARPADEKIIALEPTAATSLSEAGEHPFSGFVPVSGWEPTEGPVPEAFLPPFHWATGPETILSVRAEESQSAQLEAHVLTYSEGQSTGIELNGVEIARLAFPRVNQKENLSVPLALHPGDNRIVFRHSRWIDNTADPRKLALIFLSLRIVPV
jgi:hypothetical protein